MRRPSATATASGEATPKPKAVATKPAAAAATPKAAAAAAAPLSLSIRLPNGGILRTGLGGKATLAAAFAYLRKEKPGQFAHLDAGCLRLVSRGAGAVRTLVEGGPDAGKT
jgi:hypothetical protein